MKQKIRVLLVTLKATAGYNIAPPIGVYQLRHYLTRRGIDCDILDREFEDTEPYVEMTRRGTYDIIGFSVSHDHMMADLNLIWRLRAAADEARKSCIIIAGGQEATLNDKQWLELGIDVVFKGFGEKSLYKFCQRVEANPPEYGSALDLPGFTLGLTGIAYQHRDGSFVGEPSPALTAAEFREICYEQVLQMDMPFHAYWDKLRTMCADSTLGASEFFFENVRVFTTSHCPRRCGFCNSQNFLPRAQGGELPITQLNAEEVANLVLMYIDKYGARSILFSDDDFPVGNRAGLERVRAFCEMMIGYKESGRIPKDIRFSCQARVADFVTNRKGGERGVNMNLLRLMARAGFMSIGMGVETYSDRAMKLPSVNKLGVVVADCHRVINAMLEIGLVPQTNLILGIPEYTVDELAETMAISIEYIRRGCDVAIGGPLVALPGAPIYDSDQYEIVSKKWTHPVTGEEADIAEYFVPHDPTIAKAMSRWSEIGAEELDEIVRNEGWDGMIIHKRIIGVTRMLGLAKAIGRPDLADKLNDFLDEILAKEETYIEVA